MKLLDGERTSAFGVGSVWMNMVRRVMVAEGETAPWLHGCARGRCCAEEDVMGDDFWCRHLVVMRGAVERIEGVARERLRMTARGIVVEAIVTNVDVCRMTRLCRGDVCLIGSMRFEVRQYDEILISTAGALLIPANHVSHVTMSAIVCHCTQDRKIFMQIQQGLRGCVISNSCIRY